MLATSTAAAEIAIFFLIGAGAITLYDRWRRKRWKTCPDCAEKVVRQANVCKHCGRRFTDPSVS